MVCAMKKAGVLSILLLAVLLAVAAEAPQPTKVPPIGYLGASDPVFESSVPENSAGSARAWLRRRTEYRHRVVPLCGGEAPSEPGAYLLHVGS